MHTGIRILERMGKLGAEQGDSAIFSIAEWIEELEDKNRSLTLDKARLVNRNSELAIECAENDKTYEKYVDVSLENVELNRELEAHQRQVKRLLAKIDRLESVVYRDEC